MLIPGNATFRRCVRDEKGAILQTLVFEDGKPVDVEGDDLEAVRKDVGPALCVARDDRDQPDWKATERFSNPEAEQDEPPLAHVARKMSGAKKQKQSVGAE